MFYNIFSNMNFYNPCGYNTSFYMSRNPFGTYMPGSLFGGGFCYGGFSYSGFGFPPFGGFCGPGIFSFGPKTDTAMCANLIAAGCAPMLDSLTYTTLGILSACGLPRTPEERAEIRGERLARKEGKDDTKNPVIVHKTGPQPQRLGDITARISAKNPAKKTAKGKPAKEKPVNEKPAYEKRKTRSERIEESLKGVTPDFEYAGLKFRTKVVDGKTEYYIGTQKVNANKYNEALTQAQNEKVLNTKTEFNYRGEAYKMVDGKPYKDNKLIKSEEYEKMKGLAANFNESWTEEKLQEYLKKDTVYVGIHKEIIDLEEQLKTKTEQGDKEKIQQQLKALEAEKNQYYDIMAANPDWESGEAVDFTVVDGEKTKTFKAERVIVDGRRAYHVKNDDNDIYLSPKRDGTPDPDGVIKEAKA